MQNQKGFSLIETSIGLVIFGLIGVIIMTSLAVSSRSNLTNANLTQAESLARSQLEYLQSQTYSNSNPPVYQSISVPNGYSFVTNPPMATTIDNGLQQLNISVKYNNNILFTVTSYKANR